MPTGKQSDLANLASLAELSSVGIRKLRRVVAQGLVRFPLGAKRSRRRRPANRGSHRRQRIPRQTPCCHQGEVKVADIPTSFPAGIDFESVLRIISKQIYETPLAFIRENVQNAVDAIGFRLTATASSPGDDQYRIDISLRVRHVVSERQWHWHDSRRSPEILLDDWRQRQAHAGGTCRWLRGDVRHRWICQLRGVR